MKLKIPKSAKQKRRAYNRAYYWRNRERYRKTFQRWYWSDGGREYLREKRRAQ